MTSSAVVWSLDDFTSSFGGGVEVHGNLNLQARRGQYYLDCAYNSFLYIYFLYMYILFFSVPIA